MLRITFIFAGLLLCQDLWAITFERYHSQVEINRYMRQVASDHAPIATLGHLGTSRLGREINYLVITKGDATNLPTLYLNATHHGNEKSSTEAILGLIDHLIRNRDTSNVTALLETYALYFQPLVNPDGHAANSRNDTLGRDPNRDYAFPGRDEGDAFKIHEIALVKGLVDRIKPRAAAAYHSGMTGVLWPLGSSNNRAPDTDIFYTLAKRTAESMAMKLYMQSYYDYPTYGEFIDYAYTKHGTLALTFELSRLGTPPAQDLHAVVQRSIIGAMTFLFNVMDLDQGLLEVEPAPLAPPQIFARQGIYVNGRVE